MTSWFRQAYIALLALAAASTAAAQQAAPVVAAYLFPQNVKLNPAQVNVRALTRINYAFANIANGRMVEGFATDAANFATLNALRKQNPSLTVLVSVGGWLGSGGFSDAALTAESRAVFADSVMAFLRRYNLDGLDVDWEYPGLPGAGHTFRAEDKHNFTLLLGALRQRLDEESKKSGKKLYLTIAAGASEEFLEHTEMAAVARQVDTVNLMGYDYYEPSSDKLTGHHAPLFTNPADPKKISVDASVHAFLSAGVPAEKMVMGVPFYGHAWGQVAARSHGLYQPGRQIPNLETPYSAIASSLLGHGYVRYWDAAASAPYLYNARKRIFVSYEDAESIAAKGRYVREHHMAGMMFWSYENDSNGKLLHAIDTALGLHTAQ